MTKSKRLLMFPFSGLMALTMFTSTAFACTIFKGTFTIQGNASTSKVTSTGLGNGMNQTVSSGVARASFNGGSVTVWTGRDANGRKLPQGDYQIRFYNSTATAPGYSKHSTWVTDCMFGSAGETLGSVVVNSVGKIKGQPKAFSLPNGLRPDTPPQESTVCISDLKAAYGNQAPLTIV